ncbi:PAS domain S-box protein [Polyangium aurulentum]|uniref:PAS domain S-box protein n=1 Tax=Polyangium aurulentum TaxID=2567896 RepID=UPI0010ADB90F|nr:PAS domain S-box protein [Polyangium aurulentum]UQA54595.1 PAS domain S-box protein [Polyangium aurulentum]
MAAETVETLRARIEELERQNAELTRALHLKERAYAALVEDQRELVCRFLPDGRLSFVNDAYCRYFDKKREELEGHSFMPLLPEEDQAAFADVSGRLAKGEPFVEIEHRVIVPGGEVRWLHWIDRPLRDEAGNIVETHAVGLDVTDRKRAEEHAQKSEELREQLVQAQEQALRELSTPLIPIADEVLALPLVGRMDDKRAQMVLETLLEGVVSMAAETVLLDVTGITVIDTHVAEALARAAQAVKLLGARVVLTGIQPHVAQTLVTMGIDMQGVRAVRSLKEGIAWAMQERARSQVKR